MAKQVVPTQEHKPLLVGTFKGEANALAARDVANRLAQGMGTDYRAGVEYRVVAVSEPKMTGMKDQKLTGKTTTIVADRSLVCRFHPDRGPFPSAQALGTHMAWHNRKRKKRK